MIDVTSKTPVPSHFRAHREVLAWLNTNGYHNITDKDGVIWHLQCHLDLVPNPLKPVTCLYKVTVTVDAGLTVPELLTHRILQLPEDERLAQLIHQQTVKLAMRPFKFQCDSMETARARLSQCINATRQKIRDNMNRAIKRKLIGRWIDQQGFGLPQP